MRVLSYEPSEDWFFVAVTWDEYRQVAAAHEIDMGYAGVEEVIEAYKGFQESQKEEDPEYDQYIKTLYEIEDMPDICLIVSRDLSFLGVDQYDYPFGYMWNGYSPWKKIKTVAIDALEDLETLECVSKEQLGGDVFALHGYKEPKPEPATHTMEDILKSAIENNTKKGAAYNLQWSGEALTPQKLGAFCKQYAKMTLLSYGINVYTPEADGHGIDFITESRNGFLKFQVKGIRLSSRYVFMRKEYFNIEDEAMFLFLILLADGEHPDLYVIPASVWRQESKAFVSHDYEGKKSKPEYGVNISQKNMQELEKYRIEKMLSLF